MRSPVAERGRSCSRTPRSSHSSRPSRSPSRSRASRGGSCTSGRSPPTRRRRPSRSPRPRSSHRRRRRARAGTRRGGGAARRRAATPRRRRGPARRAPRGGAPRSRDARGGRRDEKCDGRSPASWTMRSARSVSIGSIPAAASASFSPISSVVSDLTLTTLRSPVADTRSTTSALASAASRAQCTTPPAAVTAASSRTRSSSRRNSARWRRASPLSGAPASRASRRPQRRGARGSSSSRGGRSRASSRPRAPPLHSVRTEDAARLGRARSRREHLREVDGARGRAAALEPPRRCRRHDASHAQTASAPVSSTRRSLSESIAVETSAFRRANVPPKPQHSVASASGRSSTPVTDRRSNGPVAEPEHPERVARGC